MVHTWVCFTSYFIITRGLLSVKDQDVITKYKCNGSGNENYCYGKGKNVGVVGVDVDDRMEEESFNNQFRCLFGDF